MICMQKKIIVRVLNERQEEEELNFEGKLIM